MQAFSVGAETYTGRRPNNEDAYGTDPDRGLFVVADGMGGTEGGEIASKLAIKIIRQFFEAAERNPEATWPFVPEPGRSEVETKVDIAVRMADRAIKQRRKGSLAKMGATLAVAAFDDDELVVGHLGDSRVYRMRGGELEQLTRDHSMYNKFVDAGATLPPRDEFPYNNVITRALGHGDDPKGGSPELRRLRARPGDTYLLCTDGLSNTVPAERIVQLLRERPTKLASRFLIREAYELGSTDNITAVVVGVEDERRKRPKDRPSQATAVGARRSGRRTT